MKNNIEKKIQSAFENYQVDLNNEEIWDNIEPHLKKKKKRRFIFLWFLLGAIGLGFLFVNKDKFGSHKSNKNDTISQQLVEKKKTSTMLKEKEICIEDTGSTEEKKQLLEKSGKLNRRARRTIKESRAITGFINTNEEILEPEEVFLNVIGEIETEDETVVYTDFEKDNNSDVGIENESADIIAQMDMDTNDEDDEKLKRDGTDKVKKDREVKKKNASKKKKKRKKKKKNKKKKTKKKRKKSVKTPWKNYAQLTTAAVLPAKVLQTNFGSGIGIGVLDKRKDTESFAGAFAFNFNIQSVQKRGFVVQYGLEYLEIDEKFYFKEVKETEVITTGTVGIVENERGEVIDIISGEKLIKTTKIKEVKKYNNYRFINIPVGIGRSWKYRRNHYKFITGLEYNVFFNFNGTIFTSQTSTSSGDRFESSPGLGLWMSGEYRRSINDRLSWVFAPKIRIPFANITKEDARFVQKYYTLNLNVGLTYFLNPKKKKNS